MTHAAEPADSFYALHAQRLDDAERAITPIAKLTNEHPLTVAGAYRIQEQRLALRSGRGDWEVGYKMGLTSRAKMVQVGVDEPLRGFLTRRMQLADGAELDRSEFIHPRVEPEIAFFVGADIVGPISVTELATHRLWATTALEVIDSRYVNFEFTLPDLIADNASGSRFILGETVRKIQDINLGNLGMVLEVDGVATQFASSAAILESPLRSVAALANMLARERRVVKEGSVIIAGASTAAVSFDAGARVALRVDGLGTVRASMAPRPS